MTKKKPVTYDALYELPENRVGEIVEGELYSSPRPTGRHSLSSSVLGHELIGPFQIGRNGPGGWWILDEPEVHFGQNVLVPDLAGWRRERLTDLAVPFFTVAPDWICEVLSPSTARLDRIRKMPVYAGGGVSHAWLLDPILRTLEVFTQEGGVWRMIGGFEGPAVVRAPPFHELELELSSLWLPEKDEPTT